MRLAALGLRLSAFAAIATALGCGANARVEQARIDSLRQDSVARAAVRTADSARIADSITAATKAKSPTPTRGKALVGRDSIDPNPKVIGLPVVPPDTTEK